MSAFCLAQFAAWHTGEIRDTGGDIWGELVTHLTTPLFQRSRVMPVPPALLNLLVPGRRI